MKAKKAVLAALVGTAALAAAPAFADNGWHRGHYYGHPYYQRYAYAPRVVYAPAPVYYYPAPVYRPAPVVVAPALSIRLRLPL